MNMLLCMVSRNLKIFLKDKANIFFSLLFPLIVLALYVLFLGKIQVDNLNAALAETGVSGAESAVQAFCDSWMLAGALSSGWLNWVLNVVLIVFFAYFYTSMVFNPDDTAENLKRQGGFIPGVRPGRATANYIKNALNKITLPSAIFLAIIAIVPSIVFSFTGNQLIQSFGGTSVLIMVGVVLDTLSKVESQLKMYDYDGFFK